MSEKNAPQSDSGSSPIGEISQEPSAFEAFLDANQKKLFIAGLIAILCIIGYVIFDGIRNLSAKNAAAKVAAARTVPELDDASKDHKGSNAGGSALIFKSQLLWRDQQREEAVKAVEEFIGSYPEHPAIGNAYASLGSYQQQLGKTEEAKAAFQKAAETEDSSAASLALLSLGDLALNAGNGDEAKPFYDRIITEYEDSHFQVKAMARERIALIGVSAPSEKAPGTPTPTLNPSPLSLNPTTNSAPVVIPALDQPIVTGIPVEAPAKTPSEPAPAETEAETEAPTEMEEASEAQPTEENE